MENGDYGNTVTRLCQKLIITVLGASHDIVNINVVIAHLHITTLDTLDYTIMAATQKLYPRGTVKRIVKAHSNRSVSKNADILVCRSNSLSQVAYANHIIYIDFLGLHAIHATVRLPIVMRPCRPVLYQFVSSSPSCLKQ